MTKTSKKQQADKRRLTVIWAALLCLFVGELLFYTWCRVQCVRTGYDISAETRRHKSYSALQSNLKIELARLKAPENISRIAQSQLALGMPEPNQIIVVP
ncbi:MAG: hypothetical protein HKP58_14930 [Desulfatitalea sp.]|nr:cell division protein FtsL [Desulfatitalea sp.]NNK01702.1 hypothetical protein [Desulfatitalea sp.]